MTSVAVIATVAALSSLAFSVEAKTEQCADITKEGVAELFSRWNGSLATGDPAKVAANYAQESILLATISNQPRLTASDRIDYFRTFLRRQPQGKIDLRMIQVGCNQALDAGIYTFTFGDGSSVQARYSFTYGWNGRDWLITSHHSSAMPERK